jgi:hypothetical protein|tara:strand:- start:24431 stop:24712 length:282 start_codon:yes stop_codon:yes gene_type:complete
MQLVCKLRQLTFDEIFGGEILLVGSGVWCANGEDMGHQIWIPLCCSPDDEASPDHKVSMASTQKIEKKSISPVMSTKDNLGRADLLCQRGNII